MRRAVVLGACLAAGSCGRVGFDATGDGGGGGDDGTTGDGPIAGGDAPAGCTRVTYMARDYLWCARDDTWFEARDFCTAQGMQMIRIDDAGENLFVRSIADPFPNPQVWIGANDLAVDDVWRWVDGTQFWQGDQNGAPVGGLYNAWNSNEPSDQQGLEDCAESIPMALWLDQPCTNLDTPFCEQL